MYDERSEASGGVAVLINGVRQVNNLYTETAFTYAAVETSTKLATSAKEVMSVQ